MIYIEEVIVVEGRDDTSAVLSAVQGVTIETHGYGIREETWQVLAKAYETKGLIIFTDPDPAGERIRRRLTARFPKAKQAFLDIRDAAKDGDIGIENAAPESIRKALRMARGPVDGAGEEVAFARGDDDPARGEAAGKTTGRFTRQDMYSWGLDGCEGASARRRDVGRALGIGFSGSKTFLKRLNHLGVSREEIEDALVKME